MPPALAFAKKSCVLLLLFFCFLSAAQAQHEFAVSGCGLLTSASFSTGSGSAGFQINYPRRLIHLASTLS